MEERSQSPFIWPDDGGREEAPAQGSRSLKGRCDSLKQIVKQTNSFKVFRVTQAFVRKPSSSVTTDGLSESAAETVPVLSDGTTNTNQIETVQTFVNFVNEKFSFIQPNRSPDASFITNDNYYMDTIPLLTEISGTIRADTSLDDQFKFRSKLYQILVDNRQIFGTFQKMLEFHLRGWIDPESDKEQRFIMRFLCASLIVFIVNGTDCHKEFSEALCNEPGLLEILISFVRQNKNATRHDELTWHTITYAIQILYNCSMNDANLARLLETGALQASLPFIDSEDHTTSLVALLTVAYLADEKESEIFKAKRGPVEYLIRRVKEAVESADKRDSDAWTAAELIRGLGRLALNDTNKALIAECGAIPVLLEQARQDSTPSEQKDAMEVLWTLTFDEHLKNSGVFNEALTLFEILSKVTHHTCQEAAKGILWNLRDTPIHDAGQFDSADAPAGASIGFPPPLPPAADGRFGAPPGTPYGRAREAPPISNYDEDKLDVAHIMISYQWDSQALILKIKEQLEANGYKVWLDLEKMAGSILEAMAEAVEGASLVLLCCSKKYKDSQNCRAEAEYTYKKKKDYIPLIVEKKYSPDGWLGIMLGAKMYYNFSRNEIFESKMQELVRAIGERGKMPVKEEAPELTPFPVIVPEKGTMTYMSPPKPAPRNKTPLPIATGESSGTSTVGETQNPVAPETLSLQPAPDHSQSGQVTICLSREDVATILSRKKSSDVKHWDAGRVQTWMEEHSINRGKVGHLTGAHLHFLCRMKQDAPTEYYRCIKENLLLDLDQMAALTNALEEL